MNTPMFSVTTDVFLKWIVRLELCMGDDPDGSDDLGEGIDLEQE